ncbi:endonuclease YncB(thermonuclease family) [Sphingobium sp. JAI105]|uniref:thermonuclease family protein n=1 Tax=Sphingobium sp. JAI105 TaxID=2787715 RepID=UPI0018C914AD|nr:thermonuclease family protein [Sphingobium sp. JAI105]MBG6118770.1 endonuclease YncB(thermonuclease family) [Sphingobium sp. JAI105]
MPIFSLLAVAALCVGSVHDGDTIRTCAGERIRIANIDAPEMRGSPKCQDRRRRGRAGWCDFPLAIRSRDALAAFLQTGPAQIERSGVDRYGRTLATISVGGRDAGDHLIAKGFARRW